MKTEIRVSLIGTCLPGAMVQPAINWSTSHTVQEYKGVCVSVSVCLSRALLSGLVTRVVQDSVVWSSD